MCLFFFYSCSPVLSYPITALFLLFVWLVPLQMILHDNTFQTSGRKEIVDNRDLFSRSACGHASPEAKYEASQTSRRFLLVVPAGVLGYPPPKTVTWVAVKELQVSYYKKEAFSFTYYIPILW